MIGCVYPVGIISPAESAIVDRFNSLIAFIFLTPPTYPEFEQLWLIAAMFQPFQSSWAALFACREHSFFVSFITWVSLLGVALGVHFDRRAVGHDGSHELRDRLLSASAHASVARRSPIGEWRRDIEKLQGSPGLVGAAPIWTRTGC